MEFVNDLPARGLSLQDVKGSPSYPGRHIHIAIWLLTLHWALIPQVPGQGSIHLFLWHALIEGQSELTTHSGLHATYGSPKYSGIHWQAAALPLVWQFAFVPQGDGLQGSIISVVLGGGVAFILHTLNGSPTKPGSHIQLGWCRLTLQ